MKKALIILISILILVITIALLAGPNFAKTYIEDNSIELVGRQIKMSELDFNAFNGHFLITDFKLYENNDSTEFVQFDTLYTDLTLYKLFGGVFLTEALHIKGLNVNVWMQDEGFNFDDLIPPADSIPADTTIKTEDSFINIFTINDIQILYSDVTYDDRDLGAYHNLKDINVKIPGITFGDKQTKAGLEFALAKGGKFNLDVDYDLEESSYECNMGVEGLDLNPFLIYTQSSMNITKLEGVFSGNVNIIGDLDTPATPIIKGSMHLNNFMIADNDGIEAFKLGSLFMDAKELNLLTNSYHFGSLTLTNPTINSIQYPDFDNLSTLMKEEMDSTSTAEISVENNVEEEPLTYLLEEFRLNAGVVNYTDKAVANGPFNYSITEINLKADSLTEGRNVTFNMDAIMNGAGTFKGFVVTDPGNPEKGGTFNMDLRKIPIEDFSVFSLNSTAYPIKSGRLSFQTKNKIKGNHLNSHLIMKLYKTEFNDKVKTVKPEYKVPMKLGVMVLEDPKRLIHIDVPAEGDIDDPEFKYSKLIWKVVMNVLVKAATSPYNLLADAVGASEDDIKFIRFELIQYELGPEQTTQLDLITDVLTQKPGISVTSKQVLDKEKERKLIKVYLAKKGLFLQQNYGSDSTDVELDEVDIAKVLHMDETPELITFLETKTQSIPGELSFSELVDLYVVPDDLEKTHQRVINARIKNMQAYIATKGMADRFVVTEEVIDDVNRNKPRFEMEYQVKEE
jgi:hypothetical protein